MPYWMAPDGALDDAEEMGFWAAKAFTAALRLAAGEVRPDR